MVADGTRALAGDERPSAHFIWEEAGQEAEETRIAGGESANAHAAVDALVARFFRAFSNRGRLPTIAAIPSMLLPEAVVTIVTPGALRGIEVCGVRSFVGPRAGKLLLDGS